jgi:hypothetical protein
VVGEGDQTISDAIITATIPGQPQTPALRSSSKTHIEIIWSDPLDLGGTTLDSYVIEMDQGTTNGADSYTIVQIQENEASDSYYTSTYLNELNVAKSLVPGDIY